MVIPFGLCNALATFQRLVMYIFTDLLFKSMTVYIDDFSTQSSTSEHLQCVREALIKCRQMRLALNPDKTFLGVQRRVLLGYVVSENRREPDKVAVIDGLATPINAKGIAKLLRHVGWYRELIPDFAKIAVPITQLLKKDIRFVWTDDCQKAFEELRSKLSTYPVLRPLSAQSPHPSLHPSPGGSLGLIHDYAPNTRFTSPPFSIMRLRQSICNHTPRLRLHSSTPNHLV